MLSLLFNLWDGYPIAYVTLEDELLDLEIIIRTELMGFTYRVRNEPLKTVDMRQANAAARRVRHPIPTMDEFCMKWTLLRTVLANLILYGHITKLDWNLNLEALLFL